MARIYQLAGDSLSPLDERLYDSEQLLQDLLSRFPEVLGGSETSDLRWLLIEQECSVPDSDESGGRWALDHLFVDSEGVPTLVEVKRSTDTRIRREVVGQMLDYAANALAHWPVDHIQSLFDMRCEKEGLNPAETLAALVGEDGADDLWQNVKTNLQAGRVRLIFVADRIPPELARIVEFLNEQMDPAEVLALEVHQFVGEGVKTLVPRVIGRTASAQRRKTTSGSRAPNLTEAELLARVEDATYRGIVEQFFQGMKEAGLTVELGSSGASCRLRVPNRKTPISLAWFFPPEVVGWLGLRDLTLGYESQTSVPIVEGYIPFLEEYFTSVGAMPGAVRLNTKNMKIYTFPPDAVVKSIDAIIAAVRAVAGKLRGVSE